MRRIFAKQTCNGFVTKLKFSNKVFLSLKVDFIFTNRDAALCIISSGTKLFGKYYFA